MSHVRVVLADDHQIVSEGLQRLLEPEFEVVDIVSNGFKLLNAVREHKPDVVVCDITMPGLSGLDALEELKQEDTDVRVVILTMHHNVAYAHQALNAVALGYVLKTAAPEELILAVRAAAAGRTFITSDIAGEVLAVMRTGNEDDIDPIHRLTLRQREILRLLVDGHSAKQIAGQLDISPRTVEFHKYAMMETVGVSTSVELIRLALQHGILEA